MAGGSSATDKFASTLTDLMTSLAVIFILLLVVFLKQSHDQSRKAKDEVREQLQPLLTEKSLALKQDPEDPLKLTVMVGEDQLRFPVNSAALSPQGADFIRTFFKNFAQKVCDPSLREKIDSLVIEGHTDTSGEKTPEGVRHNIALSQKRSFSVLEEALSSVQSEPSTYECLLKLTSANGRGSRSPILVDNVYDPDLSRRVEIKIRVRSSEQQFKSLAEAALGHPHGVPDTVPAASAPVPGAPNGPVAAPISTVPAGAAIPISTMPAMPGMPVITPLPPVRPITTQ